MKLVQHAGGNLPNCVPMGLVQPLGVHDGFYHQLDLDGLTLGLALLVENQLRQFPSFEILEPMNWPQEPNVTRLNREVQQAQRAVYRRQIGLESL